MGINHPPSRLNDALLYMIETWAALAGLYVLSSVVLLMLWVEAGDTGFLGHGNTLGSTAYAVNPASCFPPNLRLTSFVP